MEDVHYFGQGRLIMTSYKNFDDTTNTKGNKKEPDNKKDSILYKFLSFPLYNRSILRYKL